MKFKVWSKDQWRFDIIDDHLSSESFSFSVLTNVLIQIQGTEIIIFHSDKEIENIYPHLTFKTETIEITGEREQFLESAVLIHAAYNDIYFHWIYDILPQLKVIDNLPDDKIIISRPTQKFQIESLQLLCNIKNVTWSSKLYRVKVLTLPLPTTKHLMPFNFVFEFYTEKFRPKVKTRIKNKIYITRGRKFKRAVLNEKALINVLKAEGFSIYNLEDHSFTTQVDIFRNAGVILSAHGSGLANIVFCDPGTLILEIYGPGCGERCFARISNYLRLNYRALEINVFGYQSFIHRIYYTLLPNKNRFDFRVNLNVFKENISKYLAKDI